MVNFYAWRFYRGKTDSRPIYPPRSSSWIWLKLRRSMISMFLDIGNIIRKKKKKNTFPFASLVLANMFLLSLCNLKQNYLLPNHKSFLRRAGQISVARFPLVFAISQQKPCYKAFSFRLRNLRIIRESYFQFYWNRIQTHLKNFEAYLPLFFEITHIVLNILAKYDLT